MIVVIVVVIFFLWSCNCFGGGGLRFRSVVIGGLVCFFGGGCVVLFVWFRYDWVFFLWRGCWVVVECVFGVGEWRIRFRDYLFLWLLWCLECGMLDVCGSLVWFVSEDLFILWRVCRRKWLLDGWVVVWFWLKVGLGRVWRSGRWLVELWRFFNCDCFGGCIRLWIWVCYLSR